MAGTAQATKLKIPRNLKHHHHFGVSNDHPLLDLPQKVEQIEISILNGGILFDLELPVAWEMLSSRKAASIDKVWVYR